MKETIQESHSKRIPLVILVIFVASCLSTTPTSSESSPQIQTEESDFSRNKSESTSTTSCSGCTLHGEARARRLLEIKHDILHKLGLRQVPNVTAKELPPIPPLNDLLGRYGLEAGSDDEDDKEDEDSGENQVDGRVTRMAPMDEMMSSDMAAMDQPEIEYQDYLINSEKAIAFARSCELFFCSFICCSS